VIPIFIEPENAWKEEQDSQTPAPSKREKEWEVAIGEYMEFDRRLHRKQQGFFDTLCGD
jgi:hypothetical protein